MKSKHRITLSRKSKRRIALAAMLVAAGLGAGYIMLKRDNRERVAIAEPEPAAPPPSATETALPVTPETVPTATLPPAAETAPPSAPPAAPIPIAPQPAPPQTTATEGNVEEACPVTFDLGGRENAMLTLTLAAPCRADERVVVKHGGLVVTGRLSATGTLFLDLPAMTTDGAVEVVFPDGTLAKAAQPMPEVAARRRVAVQWQDHDAFQLHAFESGADYGQPGHVSAATPQTPSPGTTAKTGFLTRLGDDTVRLPMLAEVYTFPIIGPAKIAVEAAVTAETCGREMQGETVVSIGGKVTTLELTMAMPDCTAQDSILILKNPVPALKLTGK
jgi:hypothetical protein